MVAVATLAARHQRYILFYRRPQQQVTPLSTGCGRQLGLGDGLADGLVEGDTGKDTRGKRQRGER